MSVSGIIPDLSIIVYLFFLIVGFVVGDLLTSQLKLLCPEEKDFCAAKVSRGECFGSTLKAEVIQRQCHCSCEAVHHERIQKCCRTVGERDMKFCLPLCRYNTTSDELGSTLGVKCLSQLTTWAYCAADASDQTQCCAARGVPPECRSFCKGDVPTCDMQSILSYQSCLQYMDSIIKCQRLGLSAKSRYDPEWSSECEWEGK